MTFYEYLWANCGHLNEELQKVTDKPLRKCPACGKNKLSRLMSAPVFRLKGGGWYADGYGSAGGGSAADGSVSAESKPAGASAASSETADAKPAKPAAEKSKGKKAVA